MQYLLISVICLIVITFLVFFIVFQECDLVFMFYKLFGKSTKSLNNKTIWIIGASSGLGKQLAIKLATNCSNVNIVLTATPQSVDNLESVKSQLLQVNNKLSSENVLVLPMDITHYQSHQSSLETVIKTFGQLDLLINNAGKYQFEKFVDSDLEFDSNLFKINFFGPMHLTRLIANYWIKSGHQGQIAVTSSVAGKMILPRSSTYCASKFALSGLFEVLRAELGFHNITVSVICPGPLNTSFTPRPTKFKKSSPIRNLYMSPERCANYYLIALANQLSEVWISRQPVLLLMYCYQYCPTLTRAIHNYIINQRHRKRSVNKIIEV